MWEIGPFRLSAGMETENCRVGISSDDPKQPNFSCFFCELRAETKGQ